MAWNRVDDLYGLKSECYEKKGSLEEAIIVSKKNKRRWFLISSHPGNQEKCMQHAVFPGRVIRVY